MEMKTTDFTKFTKPSAWPKEWKRRRFLSVIAAGLAIPSAPGFVPAEQNKHDDWLAAINPIPLSDWGPAEMAKPDDIDPMNGITCVTVHHDGLPIEPLETDKQIRNRLQAIRDLHKERFADIGYHFLIDPLGRVWCGRPLEYQGAHVSGHNGHNVGIVVLGNFDEDERPTAKALDALYDLILRFMQKYKIETKMVFTHCELSKSPCPGKHLQSEMEKARITGGILNPVKK